MSEYLLRAVDISKSFGAVHALQGVTLEIKPGEVHCLAGENGCGKSTIIKVICGVHKPDGGHIEFDGKSYTEITPLEAINMGVQVIYQDFSIFPKSVWQDPDWISMSLALEGGAWADRIFAQSFPGRGGSSRYGAEAFRIWVRNGNVTVRLPKDREGTDIWCIAYILWGQGKDFRFYTVEQTPYGIMIGLVDRDLRHYHLTPAGDGLEDTLDILEHLEIE